MQQLSVRAFARGARSCALAAVALGFGATTLLAQATGKIEGRVRDQAGAPGGNEVVIGVGGFEEASVTTGAEAERLVAQLSLTSPLPRLSSPRPIERVRL